jgi:hypothetical protein
VHSPLATASASTVDFHALVWRFHCSTIVLIVVGDAGTHQDGEEDFNEPDMSEDDDPKTAECHSARKWVDNYSTHSD